MPSFEGNLLTHDTKCGHNKLETQLNAIMTYGKIPESLSHLGLNGYWVLSDRHTDGRTDRITIASTRLSGILFETQCTLPEKGFPTLSIGT